MGKSSIESFSAHTHMFLSSQCIRAEWPRLTSCRSLHTDARRHAQRDHTHLCLECMLAFRSSQRSPLDFRENRLENTEHYNGNGESSDLSLQQMSYSLSL